MIGSLIGKLVRARWGSILPELFKAAAEGKFGSMVQKVYWASAKYKTVTGAVLLAAGAALETLAAAYPDMAWAAPASRYVYLIGGFLAAVGLVDGGVRAPWPTKPDGTASWQETKK